ncbi:MAG TPA: hypothetical protein VGS41_09075, partial [Chthonomonadales bacterium]|nr:hypothetical protein [Chthonomonadales bacterium]
RTDNVPETSVYAAVNRRGAPRLTLVEINKSSSALRTRVTITGRGVFRRAALYRVQGGSPEIQPVGSVLLTSPNRLIDTLPPMSATTVVLQP